MVDKIWKNIYIIELNLKPRRIRVPARVCFPTYNNNSVYKAVVVL